MRRAARRLDDYLGHILEAIERIERYIQGVDKQAFMANALLQDAVLRNIEIIGEASHNIELRFAQFAAIHPELPLAIAYQMRNAVAHGYFQVDLEIVWRTIQHDLAALRARVQAARPVG